ncbi:hypothetical protein J2X12_002928 [Pseudarthrobacter oxydans]|uniref:Uncharacterized protein n=1 Tax=Pseudarthrobacter oxydans TaxID=1671 RepID=A0AAW8NEZ1_PSEOX|nr:hypothetical protein [Pseudarthrobacter oxydans]MDR6794335.1 hypothetical protein [Pseudarthrobacter oxydans]MDR7164890.1 hypothetical protein [Pseudarthrobacter oxydans]
MSFFAVSNGAALKFETQGQEIVAQISGPVSTVQATEFGSDKPATWRDGSPKLKALVPLTTEAGESKTLHVPAGSLLQKAIGAALAEAGASDLEVGGVLGVTWTGWGQGKNPANPPKSWSARYITAADVAAQAA